MDAFTVIIGGGTVLLFVFLLLLGLFYPGSGADQLDWRPTRSPETEAQNEVDDLDQMLAATNARRRARGREELTEDSIRADIGRDLAEQAATRDQQLLDVEIAQVLERKNARRRKRGLPEITLEDYRRRLGGEGRR